MVLVQLRQIAQARSGDKGNTVNIAVFASNASKYEVLIREVTAERVKAHFDGLVSGEVTRYLVPNLHAMNFVCKGALSGGGSASMRMDNLGKCYAASLMRLEIEAGDSVNLSKS
ncbi:MAG: AtuA-related protein [Bacillota bacterium]